MKLFHFLLLSIFLLSLCLHAQEYKLEKIELDSYPKVRFYFSGENLKKLPKEPITLTEKIESEVKEIEFVKIIQSNEKKSLSIILSIGLSSWHKNQVSQEIVNILLNELSEDSVYALHFYDIRTIYFSENLSKQDVKRKLNELELGTENDFISNLNFIYNSLSESKPDLHIVIAPSETKAGDISHAITQRKDSLKIPILIIGSDSLTYKAAASLSNGNFIFINDIDLKTKIIKYLNELVKPLSILEYESPLDIFTSFPSQEVEVEIYVGNKKFLKSYTVTPFTFFLGIFSNVQIVVLFLLTILVFCLIFAYVYYQRKKKIQWEEYRKKQEEIRKSDLYYHENVASYGAEKQTVKVLASREITEEEWKKFEEEELELDLGSEELKEDKELANLPEGESYEKAFFIQKEGPNPGRQFFINKEETVIGRDPEVDLVLLDSTVSLRHAKVKRINKTYYIFDLVSERGILINGKKLLKPRPLYDFDEIRLGKVLLLFRGN